MPRRSPCYLVLLPILLWPSSQCFCGLNRLQLAVKTRKRSFLLQVTAKRSKDDQCDMVPVPPYFYAVKLDPDNYGQMAAYFADTYERNPEALAEAFRDRGKKAGIREVRSIRAESMQTSFFDMGSRAKQPYVFGLGVDGTGSSAQIKKLLAEAISELCNKAGTTPKRIQAGSIRTDLFQLKPTARLADIFKQGDDVFEMIADYLAVTVETLPANLANAINGSCNKAKITVKSIETAGSVRTKTAAWSSSDLDLNIYSAENVTRKQRSLFKDYLNARLLNEKDGWSVHRLGKKCLQLKGPRHENVDIAFVNTTFNWGFIDRRANVEFFASHKSAQRAVRMFKYVFQNAQGLCGVHIENLARDVFRTGMTAKQQFDEMLVQLQNNGCHVQKVIEDAVDKAKVGDQGARRAELRKQVKRMTTVIQSSGVRLQGVTHTRRRRVPGRDKARAVALSTHFGGC